MKLNKPHIKFNSVKWKLFSYFMIFGGIMLALLWLFQVQFLSEFYKMIKTNTVQSAANEINEALQETSYKESIDEIARKNDLCVSVLNDDHAEIYTSNRRDPRCMIDKMKESEIGSLYESAIANGGSASQLITTDEFRKEWNEDETPFHPNENGGELDGMKGRKLQNITYASVLKMTEDQAIVVLVNAEITPVDATISTIRMQLIIITIILLLLALVLAIITSRKISLPLIKINDSAKQLASGNYEVAFESKGYLEVSELSDTLNFAANELAKVQALQRELIANMSHDLRTPLTMISGYGEIIRDIPGENTAENVQIIIDETNRLTNLVNDILDLSKLQSGTQTLSYTIFNITNMIQNLIARYQKMLKEQEITLSFHYEEEMFIHGDEIKIQQVIYNLINNAITYCGDDKEVIIKQNKITDAVRIEIIDHGAGISEEELPYVWERYYKSEQHHVRASVGTGLGLSIVKNVLELHKARYGVSSILHNGTTFWIEFINES